MDYLTVPNFEKWQHYKDRTPPWIKLHRELLRNYEFSCLADNEKFHLIAIWLLASQCDNEIPNDPKWVEKQIGADSSVNLDILVEGGFLDIKGDNASNVLAERKRNAMRETETETETEEHCGSQAPPKSQKATSTKVPFQEILKTYHEKLPELPAVVALTKKRESHIRQRWTNGLPTVDAWERYFDKVRESKFLLGQSKPTNGRPVFRATFDWLINPNNVMKVVEGQYDG